MGEELHLVEPQPLLRMVEDQQRCLLNGECTGILCRVSCTTHNDVLDEGCVELEQQWDIVASSGFGSHCFYT